MNSDIRAILADHGLRATSPRLAIFDALKDATAPLSVADIIKTCPTIDKVSVYRTVETFTNIGVTTVVMHGWKQRYELAEPFRPHHHHLHCIQCGRIVEIESDKVESIIYQIGKEYGFHPTNHTFEISGLCSACTTRPVN